MRVWTRHLWKEWREQRTMLASLVALTLALVLGTARFVPRTELSDDLLPFVAAMLTAGAVAVLVNGEILGRDAGHTRHRALERLPRGVATAFRAKLAFVLVVAGIATLLGWGVGTLAVHVRPAGTPSAAVTGLNPFLVLLTLFGLWTFAVSPWAPRPSLAFPIAFVIVAAALTAPVWLVVEAGYRETIGEWWALVALLAVGAVASAAVAFRARGLGRPTWRSALRGLAVAVGFLAPIPGWAAHCYASRFTIDPNSNNFELWSAVVTDDGNHVIACGGKRDRWSLPSSATVFVVDLDTGEWSQPIDGPLRPASNALHRTTECVSFANEERVVRLSRFDGSVIDEAPCTSAAAWRPAGIGWQNGVEFYDPTRAASFTVPKNLGRASSTIEVVVLPGSWLVYVYDRVSETATWCSFDPETSATAPLPWAVGADIYARTVLEDGRVLIALDGVAQLYDSKSGDLEPIHAERAVRGLLFPSTYQVDGWMLRGSEVYVRDALGHFRLDVENLRLEELAVDRDEYILGSLRDGSLIIDTNDAVVRQSPNGARSSVIPRE